MSENRATILLVEDEPLMFRMYRRKFEADGYSVILAADGLEAVDALDEGVRPDVILLDVSMPRMDGFQFLGVLKKMPQAKHIPVLLLTNVSGEQSHIERGMAMGAADYLVKAAHTPEEVLQRVEAIVKGDQTGLGVK